MSSVFSPFLASRAGVVILDGGLATELERRGLELLDPLWSAKILVEAHEEIEAVHYEYFRAGADVGTSASYQATFAGFAARGIGTRESERLLRLSVELVERARERFWSDLANRPGRIFPLVAASIGCYGASLHDGSEYRGDYGLSLPELIEFHRPRLRVLADSGADVLAFETIPSKLEAEAVVALLEEIPSPPPAWVSFSCLSEVDVCHGEPLFECFAAAGPSEAVVAVAESTALPRASCPVSWNRPEGPPRSSSRSIRTAGRSGTRRNRSGFQAKPRPRSKTSHPSGDGGGLASSAAAAARRLKPSGPSGQPFQPSKL